MASKHDPWFMFKTVLTMASETNPPFYYFILHFWVSLFGYSEFSLRLLSALFGSLSILAIYSLGKLVFNKRTATIAALILAVSVYHIQYSQEARGYTLSVFLTIVSFYFLIKMTNRLTITNAFIYILSSVLMLYTHYFAVFTIIAQNLFYLTILVYRRRAGVIKLWHWILLQLLIIFAFIPGIMHLFIIKSSMQESFWITKTNILKLINYMILYSGSFFLLPLFSLFALVSVLGFRRVIKNKTLSRFFSVDQHYNQEPGISEGYRIYLLVLWFVVPIMIPFLISLLSTPMFVARYAITATIPFYLLASKGIDGLKSKWFVTSVGVLIVILFLFKFDFYYHDIQKHQWREVISEIENSAGKDDIIIVYPPYEKLSASYYKTRNDIDVIAIEKNFPTINNLGNRKIWIVAHTHPLNRKRFREGLSSRYNFELEKHFVRLDLFKLSQK